MNTANALNLLNAAIAAPKTHIAIVTYSDGSSNEAPCTSEKAANNHIARYARLIGKHQFISRATGEKITVVSVSVETL